MQVLRKQTEHVWWFDGSVRRVIFPVHIPGGVGHYISVCIDIEHQWVYIVDSLHGEHPVLLANIFWFLKYHVRQIQVFSDTGEQERAHVQEMQTAIDKNWMSRYYGGNAAPVLQHKGSQDCGAWTLLSIMYLMCGLWPFSDIALTEGRTHKSTVDSHKMERNRLSNTIPYVVRQWMRLQLVTDGDCFCDLQDFAAHSTSTDALRPSTLTVALPSEDRTQVTVTGVILAHRVRAAPGTSHVRMCGWPRTLYFVDNNISC